MFEDPEFDSKLARLREQWDVAERRIKKAENVRGQEIVSSAIFELRYAGRKLIDATQLWDSEDRQNPEIRERIGAYLDDAIEDCVKAKHDAIDAMMNFVTIWFSQQEESLGLSQLQHFFPEFLNVRALIIQIQERIEESRGSRTKLRDSIYDSIERDGYDQILELFNRMRLSKDRVEATVTHERRSKIALWIVAIASLGIALGDLFLHYIHG